MTIELTKEEVKGLLAAINTHFQNLPDDRTPEDREIDLALKTLRVRLTAFDPDATQRMKARLAKSHQ
jgi:hypothetical protein